MRSALARSHRVGPMRLLTYRDRGTSRAARLDGELATELPFADLGEILSAGALESVRSATGPEHPVADLVLAPPVLKPPKIICVGQNYLAHIREQHIEVPKFPTLFSKWPLTLIGARDDVLLPVVSDQADWEVELAFYIARPLRRATEAEALKAIAGYTILNDVSVRDWQRHTTQFLPGKNFESTTPVGPWMVTPEELDPLNLTIRCMVNGSVMQESNTKDFLFKPAQVAAYVSTFITLEPGDLVSTGTPAGVGDFRRPPIYLTPGSVMTTEIDGIGKLVNRCVMEGAPA